MILWQKLGKTGTHDWLRVTGTTGTTDWLRVTAGRSQRCSAKNAPRRKTSSPHKPETEHHPLHVFTARDTVKGLMAAGQGGRGGQQMLIWAKC